MKSQLSFLATILLVLGIISCTPKDSNPINGGNNVLSTTTTIAGVVVDDNNFLVKGVGVTAHGRSAITDDYGFYIIRNVSVPEGKCVVKVEKEGYFTASRVSAPKMGGVTHVHIGMLQNNARYSIYAQEGGTITLVEGCRINMPIGGMYGYVPVEANHLYMDRVKVAAHWLFPMWNSYGLNFNRYSSGNLSARRSDGSTAFLYSYGVLHMAMYMENGGKLRFGEGKKAVITCPIPPLMQKDAPAEIPMWYFDEESDMWQEEGKAVKQGEDYVGEIAHTGQWNIAVPVPTAVIKGQVKCGTDAVSFVNINIGQDETWTDENGNYECRVPAGIPLEIYIESDKNLGSLTSDEIIIEPLSEGQILTRELIIEPCSAYITGTIVDCGNKPVEGYVEATVGGRFSYTVSDAKGVFKLRTNPKGGITAIRVTAFDGRNRSLLQAALPTGTVQDVGNVSLCPDEASAFFTIPLHTATYNAVSLSDDGTRVIVGGKDDVRIFDVKTGQLLRTFSCKDCAHVQISPDKTQCLGSQQIAGMGGYKTTVWDIASGDVLLTFSGSYSFFMPDSRSVITALPDLSSGSTAIVTYSSSTGEEKRRFVLSTPADVGYVGGAPSIINIVANGTKGVLSKIAYNDVDNRCHIIIFDIEKGTILNTWMNSNRLMGNIRVAANGELLGMSEGSDPVVLYQFDGTSQLGLYAMSYSHYALSPDAKYFAVQRNTREPVQIANITTSGPVLNRYLEVPEAAIINDLAYSLDGKTLAGLWQNGICIWHL